MSDYIVSLIRTYVPLAFGAVLTWLAREAGIVVDEQTSAMDVAFAVALVSAGYYAAVRAAERAYPALGRVLLALGMTSKTPTYEPPAVRR